MDISTRRKGYLRDRQLLELLEARQALNTEQVRVLLFPFKYGLRKAQERLLKLYERKKVHRWRPALEESYVYYLGKRHGRIEHLIAINWVYCYIKATLKSWEKLQSWAYEVDLGNLQADAFVGIKNTVTGKVRFVFIELDRSDNVFDKATKYNDLYKSGKYMDCWWVKYAEKFPQVMVVTTTQARKDVICKAVEKENVNGLDFTVHLLDEIRSDVLCVVQK